MLPHHKILLITGVIIGLFFPTKSFSQVEINIQCSISYSYCGGASQSNERIVWLNTPIATDMCSYLYAIDSGNTKPVFVGFGNRIKVEPGKYVISVLPNLTFNQMNMLQTTTLAKTNDEANLMCIEVTNDSAQIFYYNYHHYCSWQLEPNIGIPN